MTEETSPEQTGPGQLAEEAATWFARMRGPEAEAHRPAFDAWLARGALHLRAYNRAVEIFSDGKFLDRNGDPGAEEREPTGPVSRRARYRWLALAMVGACIFILIGLAVRARPTRPIDPPIKRIAAQPGSGLAALLATKPGETREEELADGSTALLRSDTRLKVVMDVGRRDLFLLHGAAQFDVAHEARPFVVHAGGGSVTARGTLFEVRMDRDRHVEVRLLRGSVDVALPAASDRAAAVKRMTPGQIMTFGGPRPQIALETSAATIASPAVPGDRSDDVREFDRIRVADLVASVNATGPVHIRLSDRRLAERTISGRFRTNDAAQLADRLGAIFDLGIDRSNPSEIVLSAR